MAGYGKMGKNNPKMSPGAKKAAKGGKGKGMGKACNGGYPRKTKW